MVWIILRLVGEENEKSFWNIELDPQIPFDDLVKEIENLTYIPASFQDVRFRGERLLVVERPLIDVSFREEIVVMHSDLPWWEQYKKSADKAMKPGPERLNNAREAVQIHKRLMNDGFFMVYCSFNSFQMEYHHKIVSWTDGNIQLMREATKSYFLRQHYQRGAEDESDFVCRFEARSAELGGTRKNTLAFVKLHGQEEETKYNVKSHHFGPSSSSSQGQAPDIKEIYCYKLLELIHVGPQAQFIIPTRIPGSKPLLYIVTRWEDSFIPISGITEGTVDVDVLLQILLLGKVLFIDDLHSENCGHWKGTKEVAIVDFMPKAFFTFKDVRQAFFKDDSSVYWKISNINALEACDEATRKEVTRKYLQRWDLLSKIDLANEEITPEKNRMKQQKIGFRGFNNPTEELEQYISIIKQNLVKLTELL